MPHPIPPGPTYVLETDSIYNLHYQSLPDATLAFHFLDNLEIKDDGGQKVSIRPCSPYREGGYFTMPRESEVSSLNNPPHKTYCITLLQTPLQETLLTSLAPNYAPHPLAYNPPPPHNPAYNPYVQLHQIHPNFVVQQDRPAPSELGVFCEYFSGFFRRRLEPSSELGTFCEYVSSFCRDEDEDEQKTTSPERIGPRGSSF